MAKSKESSKGGQESADAKAADKKKAEQAPKPSSRPAFSERVNGWQHWLDKSEQLRLRINLLRMGRLEVQFRIPGPGGGVDRAVHPVHDWEVWSRMYANLLRARMGPIPVWCQDGKSRPKDFTGAEMEEIVLATVGGRMSDLRVDPFYDYLISIKDKHREQPEGAVLLDSWLGGEIFAVDWLEHPMYARYLVWASRLIHCTVVARTLEAQRDKGYRCDEMLVLLSAHQGVGKSSVLRQFLPAQFRDSCFTDALRLDDDINEQVASMSGRLICEVSEMGGYGRSRIDELKSFLSRDVDRARLKYRADVEDFPRRAAVVGSSNQIDLLKFDESGQRRFAPMVVEPRHSVFEALHRVGASCDAMWAAALNLVLEQGYSPRLPPELREVHELSAARSVEHNETASAWADAVVLAGMYHGTLNELAERGQVPQGKELTLARELSRRGWTKVKGSGGKRTPIWYAPEHAPAASN